MTPGHWTLSLYAVTGVAYVMLGVFFPRFLLSWVEAAAVLLLAIWLLPAIVRWLR
jgi:hypothetical protein